MNSHDESLYEPTRRAASVPALSLRTNYSWTLAGTIFNVLGKWGMLVAIVRLTDQRTAGEFALGVSIAAPVMLLSEMNLRAFQSTDTERRYSFCDVLGLRTASIAAALLFLCALSLLLFAERPGTWLAVVGVALMKCIDSLSDVFQGLFQQRERMDYQAVSMAMRAPLGLLMFGVGLWKSNMLIVALLCYAVASAIVLAVYECPHAVKLLTPHAHSARSIRLFTCVLPRWRFKTMRGLAVTAFPLGLADLSNSLRSNVPRYFIASQLGLAELGVFSVMAYTLVLMDTLTKPIRMAALPALSRLGVSDSRMFARQLFKIAGGVALLGVLFAAVASLGGHHFLTTVYAAPYASYASLLVGLILAHTVADIGACIGMGMIALRNFRQVAAVNYLSLAAIVALCYALIPGFGLWGVVCAIGCGSLIRIACHAPAILSRASTIGSTAKISPPHFRSTSSTSALPENATHALKRSLPDV